MSRPATARLKCNPPLGRMPVLQFMAPGELAIDATYQRSILGGDSQTLIRKIAQHWNWDLCQPLVVARRTGGELFVIDGQHRLEAAHARGDIAMLPCVVVDYASAADEAASFVHLNQQRRPLSKLDVFKAAVASEDPRSVAIAAAIEHAGLSLAPHMSSVAWKPGMVGNIGGIEQAWEKHGAVATGEALQCLATAFAGQVLAYAGTLFPGIVAVCAVETKGRDEFDPGRFASFTAKLGSRGQDTLRDDVLLEMASEQGLGRVLAAVRVVTELWWPERRKNRETVQRALTGSAPKAIAATAARLKLDHDGLAWCAQCDSRVSPERAAACTDRFCKAGH